MENLNDLIAKARLLLANNIFDKTGYSDLENFVLKNSSSLNSNPQFLLLKEVLDDIARKFDVPSILALQEGFGANSCAQ